MSYPYSVFTEPNMMVVRLSGATSLRDSKSSDVLPQWMSSSPLIRTRFTEAMDHVLLPAAHKTKVQAICTYAEALFPAPYLIGLLLELGAPRSGFRVLSQYIIRRGDAYTARRYLRSSPKLPLRPPPWRWMPQRNPRPNPQCNHLPKPMPRPLMGAKPRPRPPLSEDWTGPSPAG